MGVFRLVKQSMLPLFIRRETLFLSIMDCFTLFLYALGTRQRFTDDSQLMLLGFVVFFGIALAVTAVYGMAAALRHLFRPGRYRFVLALGVYLVLGGFGAVTAAFASFILAAAGGNS